ncbi:MAG: hypothetical protein KKH28_01435, partial [Elusimicrobia bacterium]|nr:hypothetical protein [Elusimicrobiota bacterium]
LEKKFPELLIAPGWKNFVTVGTVAGCVSLGIRLSRDVPEENRTGLELKMRESLKGLFPNAERLYTDCYHFVTQALTDIPRPERSKHIFPLVAKWAVGVVSGKKDFEGQEHVVEALVHLYQNETLGFWGSDLK